VFCRILACSIVFGKYGLGFKVRQDIRRDVLRTMFSFRVYCLGFKGFRDYGLGIEFTYCLPNI
jgi:hypothetical protein